MPAALAAIPALIGSVGTAIGGAGAAIGTALGGSALADAAGAGLVDAGLGALGGAGVGLLTHGNVGKDALFGGLGGGLFGGASSLLGGAGGAATSAASSATTGATAAGGIAAPASIAAASPDLTAAELSGSTALGSGGVLGAVPGAIPGSEALVSGTAGGAAALTGAAAPAAGGWASLLTNPSTLLSGGVMGLDALLGNKQPAGYSALQAQAAQQAGQGAQMESYANTGTLPPGLEASLTSAAQAQQAAIRSHYAAAGMSGSSAESQDLQNAALNVSSHGAQIAMQLYQAGVTQMGLSDKIYMQLMQTSLQQDNNLATAVGKFAGAIALGAKSPGT